MIDDEVAFQEFTEVGNIFVDNSVFSAEGGFAELSGGLFKEQSKLLSWYISVVIVEKKKTVPSPLCSPHHHVLTLLRMDSPEK